MMQLQHTSLIRHQSATPINSNFSPPQISAISEVISRTKLIKSADAKKALIWLLRQAEHASRPYVLAFPTWNTDPLGAEVLEAAETLNKLNARFNRMMHRKNSGFDIHGISKQVIWAYDYERVQSGVVISPKPISDIWQNSLVAATFKTVDATTLKDIRGLELPAVQRKTRASVTAKTPIQLVA